MSAEASWRKGLDGVLRDIGRSSFILLSGPLKTFQSSALPPRCRQELHEEGSNEVTTP